jgi:hypothetical protein
MVLMPPLLICHHLLFVLLRKRLIPPRLFVYSILFFYDHYLTVLPDYMNNETVTEDDAPGTTKKDQILKAVRDLLAKYPGYKVYVTGHSLGAALSTIAAYYLSVEDDIPKPVTCLNFASPRVGDRNFLQAIEHLEKYRKLRHLRVVNEHDSITLMPILGYTHVGMMVKVHKAASRSPEFSYVKSDESWGSWFGRAYDMSWEANLNIKQDHGVYRERVYEHKETLEKYDLNKMYKNLNLVGKEAVVGHWAVRKYLGNISFGMLLLGLPLAHFFRDGYVHSDEFLQIKAYLPVILFSGLVYRYKYYH